MDVSQVYLAKLWKSMYLSLLGIDIDVVEIDGLKYRRYCGNGCPVAGKGGTLLNLSILTLERQDWKK